MRRAVYPWLLLGVLVLLIVSVDQISKRWIVDHLIPGEILQPIPALSAVFRITLSQNTGAAFGFLPQAADLFLIIAIIVMIAMIYLYPRIPQGATITRIAAGLVVGGALGNALDRLQYGYVVDFINYQIPGIISNVSNLADHAIVFGVILIFLDSWRMERAAKLSGTDAETPEDVPPPVS